MLKAMSSEKLKTKGKKSLKIERKDQPSSDVVGDFVGGSIVDVALIQLPSSRTKSMKK